MKEAPTLNLEKSLNRLDGSPTSGPHPDVSNSQPAPKLEQELGKSPRTWLSFSKHWWVQDGSYYGYWTTDKFSLCNAAIALSFYTPDRVIKLPSFGGACSGESLLHGTAFDVMEVV